MLWRTAARQLRIACGGGPRPISCLIQRPPRCPPACSNFQVRDSSGCWWRAVSTSTGVVVAVLQRSAVVEPVGPLGGGDLGVVEPLPRPSLAYQFGLVSRSPTRQAFHGRPPAGRGLDPASSRSGVATRYRVRGLVRGRRRTLRPGPHGLFDSQLLTGHRGGHRPVREGVDDERGVPHLATSPKSATGAGLVRRRRQQGLVRLRVAPWFDLPSDRACQARGSPMIAPRCGARSLLTAVTSAEAIELSRVTWTAAILAARLRSRGRGQRTRSRSRSSSRTWNAASRTRLVDVGHDQAVDSPK